METRANYVLIGGFALAGFLGMLGFFLWFAQFQLDQQFDYYDVKFTSVSGLSRASDVRFAGLPVGQVVSVQLSPDQDGTVLVRLEVAGDTPVRTDSVATIETMGVTGVSFVGISAGDSSSPLLEANGDVPQITAGRSVLQTLSEDAPKVVEEAVQVMQDISNLLGGDNQQKVQQILDNLANASDDIAKTLSEFSGIGDTVKEVSADITAFTNQLEPVVNSVQTTLDTLDETLTSVTGLAGRVETSLDEADATLKSGRGALDAAQAYITGDLSALTSDLSTTSREVRDQTDLLVSDAREMIGHFSEAGTAATARLTEARQTLQDADEAIDKLSDALTSIDSAASSFEGLITNDGAALVAETREMVDNAKSAVAAVNQVAQDDLPVIADDIRDASDTVKRVIAQVGDDLTNAGGRIDEITDEALKAMAQVTETFANANETLTAIDAAMTTGERTLSAAERVINEVETILDDDVSQITADLRNLLQELDGAVAQVSDDLPAISGDLRSAADAANEAFQQVAQAVSRSAPSIEEFAGPGLQQYTQLARETRALIANLDSLTRQIQRDPARFFLSRQIPEYRR